MSLPTSTYRLQVHAGFTLDDAAAVCDYLADLGVGAVYVSPVLASTEGSDHGYDVVDPTVIDGPRGGEAGWANLVQAAHRAGLGVVVDIVPNHLGVEAPAQNPSWWSVLRDGQQSPYADWYDIEWGHPPLLLPILGSADDVAQLRLAPGPDGPELHYYDHRFPLAPGTHEDGADAQTVHERQHYRLVDWRRGDADLTYRRFFAVTGLAGVRMEDPAVFAATHDRIRRFVDDGQITGLRVDHPDGLADPADYFTRLRGLGRDLWLLGEKILEPGEQLPAWPIEGTSGYDALTEVNAVLTDPGAEPVLTRLYHDLTGDRRTAEEHVLAGKLRAARTMFAAERNRMARLVPQWPAEPVTDALAEVAARFAVYRSYLPDGVERLDAALTAAENARPDLADTLATLSPLLHDPDQEIARRLQQLSGAVMAKGIEDTAFYRYSRFIAGNEVGGDPAHVGLSVADFHQAMARRQQRLPASMTALSTHDTKRSEDVRARLAVLAEVPQEWAAFAKAFAERTAIPNPMLGYFLAQTLLGVGPVDRSRLVDYAEKAAREAADGTTWTDQDPEFEQAVRAAVDTAYDDPTLQQAWQDVQALIEPAARSNALSAKLVQLTMPGIPDLYQGTELWDYSLVDPDNRRPVDYALRRRLLSTAQPPVEDSGAAKQWITRQALAVRAQRALESYRPVSATGSAAEHLLAFDRGGVITVATLRPYGLPGWADTRLDLPDGRWHDVLTDRPAQAAVGHLLDRYPVALLVRAD